MDTFKVQVLNGSGVAGEASVINELLQAQSFQKAETDNADSYDYEETEVQIKENTSKTVFDTIKTALEGQYNVVLGDVLGEDSDFDIIVIVGERI